MKTMMAAIVMMILPAVMVAQVMDADGWNGAKWGMTLEQVKAAIQLPLERETYFFKAGTPRYALSSTEPFKLLDIPVRATFSFSTDNKLASILVRVDTVFLKSTHSHSDLFSRFKQSLTDEYGKPSYTDDNGKNVVWRLPSTSISLQWTTLGGDAFIGVTYKADKKAT
jgi:hypothetical protein